MVQQQLREKVSMALAVTTFEPATHCKHPNRTTEKTISGHILLLFLTVLPIDQKLDFTYKKENNKVYKNNLASLTCSCSYAIISFAVTLDTKALHSPSSTEFFRCCFQTLVCRAVRQKILSPRENQYNDLHLWWYMLCSSNESDFIFHF